MKAKYLAEVIEIVAETITLSNQAPLSESDLGDRAKTWMETLIKIVPFEHLRPSYEDAKKHHHSDFPVNCWEIIGRWNIRKSELETAQSVERARRLAELEKSNPVLFCQNFGYHFEGFFLELGKEKRTVKREEGLILAMLDGPEEPDILVPCKTCRLDDYNSFFQHRAGKKVGEIIEEMKPVEAEEKKIWTDPVEIIDTWHEIAGKLAAKGDGAAHGWWLQLTRIKVYLIQGEEGYLSFKRAQGTADKDIWR